ncbi:MAG: FeoA family protein [Microcoleaceae cyanobacterium MO_207.B10]|nr:FeoA family protein [Microcoleaceae cyanobacterium MO_207.B10]
MDRKYSDRSNGAEDDRSCENLDAKVKLWRFTFLGDTHQIESEDENNNRMVNVLTPSVVETNFPLTKAKRGDRLSIVKINALGDIARRLQKMGLVPKVEIEVISKNPSGSVIVAVNNHHIGLGSNPASKIIVSSTNHQ